MTTGFVGLTTPITLNVTFTNNAPILRLTGASNFNYFVETSTNLLGWNADSVVVERNGDGFVS